MGTRRRRFTLVELMIVVAIVMVLASIALPNFYEMQMRAKLAEGPINVDGIMTSLISYNASYDTYALHGTWHPDSTPSKAARPWTAGSGFDTLDWSPDGDVRCSYAANQCPEPCQTSVCLTNCSDDSCAVTHAACNVDGVGDNACATAEISDDEVNGVQWRTPPDTY